MVDQALDDVIDGFEDVPSWFIVAEFDIGKFYYFPYEVEVGFADGSKEGTVAVVRFSIILSEEWESNLMCGIIE